MEHIWFLNRSGNIWKTVGFWTDQLIEEKTEGFLNRSGIIPLIHRFRSNYGTPTLLEYFK
jgi:hypothetical protein